MRRILTLAILMALIWTGAEGQDPVIFESGFESGEAGLEWVAVRNGDDDLPPIVAIIAPVAASCQDYWDKHSCNAQDACRWDNRNDVCIADD